MPVTLSALSDLASLPFDDIIDVRSPAEYAEDHVPGALSLPVLSDEERARVGTIYVQDAPFRARKIGAALVARNAAVHLEGPLADKTGGWRPLLYCWRGGQRSGSFASILREIGWRVDTIKGGYKAYRALVVRALYETPLPLRLVVIDGGTGTAKTRLLHALAGQGAQVIDLEGLAAHRGSVFGSVAGGQPAQKGFESALARQVVGFDPAQPVFVEAESSRIGALRLPPSLWTAMIAAPRVDIRAPLDARAGHLVDEYDDMVRDPGKLDAVLSKLVRFHGHKRVDDWRALAGAGAFRALCTALILEHYDPRYARISRPDAPRLAALDLPDLSDETLQAAAHRLLAEVVR
ncbi:tRNA 2-selenouridine(34) synthase MnmH [Maritimibacter sp. HL-12]|jgi:tRNA 2-selenouridine synthase|uniref:tRNA 2-selenouridine(34) synthase MnmH n=1 Tax=Maritimibacter sp. HL-12 TaxID=1162418 RepID=UPI000A0F2118|nr:tRNA 2-selenouridine(34) synthase MnmH [Maritimibacter sp. HL-12]SMH40276.1 tRNA 2-selenouridine synthase [Maritimibacter sp. HL-12]